MKVLEYFKGRTFIFVGLIVLLAAFLIWGALSISNSWRDRDSDVRKEYLSAVDVRSEPEFSYVLSHEVGVFLAEGTVSVSDRDCVSLSEFVSDVCFSKVVRKKEIETERIETYDCGDDTCTRIVKEWVFAGSETLEAESAAFLGKTVDYRKVDIPAKSVSSRDYISDDAPGYNIGGYYHTSPKVRYQYMVVPAEFNVLVLGSTADGDFITKNARENTSIEAIKEWAGGGSVAPTVFFVFSLVVIVLGAVIVIGRIVSRDIEDGRDSGF